jgi:hypothetical protein
MRATEQYIDPVEPSYTDKFIALMACPGLPDVLGVHWVARQLGRPWEEIRQNILVAPKVRVALRAHGWAYTSQRGCKARSTFRRVTSAAA